MKLFVMLLVAVALFGQTVVLDISTGVACKATIEADQLKSECKQGTEVVVSNSASVKRLKASETTFVDNLGNVVSLMFKFLSPGSLTVQAAVNGEMIVDKQQAVPIP